MRRHKPSLTLFQSRDLSDFEPVLRGIPELGDPFHLSMLHWCGIGHRSRHLATWNVFLLRDRLGKNVLGVSGLYQNTRRAAGTAWVGWFGIVKAHRKSRLGERLLELTINKARKGGFSKLRVYCEKASTVSRFYEKNGFRLLGEARKVTKEITQSDDDLVLELTLNRNL